MRRKSCSLLHCCWFQRLNETYTCQTLMCTLKEMGTVFKFPPWKCSGFLAHCSCVNVCRKKKVEEDVYRVIWSRSVAVLRNRTCFFLCKLASQTLLQTKQLYIHHSSIHWKLVSCSARWISFRALHYSLFLLIICQSQLLNKVIDSVTGVLGIKISKAVIIIKVNNTIDA